MIAYFWYYALRVARDWYFFVNEYILIENTTFWFKFDELGSSRVKKISLFLGSGETLANSSHKISVDFGGCYKGGAIAKLCAQHRGTLQDFTVYIQ